MLINASGGKNPIGGVVLIYVEYPAGWDVHVTGEGLDHYVTYKTGESVIFLEKTGTFTVTCTNGVLSYTKTISLPNPGMAGKLIFAVDVDVPTTISYWNRQYAGMNAYASFLTTGGGRLEMQFNYQAGQSYIFNQHYAGFYTINKINVTGYAKVRVHVSSYASSTNTNLLHHGFGLTNSPGSDITGAQGFVEFTDVGWYEIDLEDNGIDGEMYIQIQSSYVGEKPASAYMTSVVTVDAVEIVG